MGCHIRKKAFTLLPVACLIMYLLLIIGSPDSAHASIHKYPESSVVQERSVGLLDLNKV